MLLMMGLRRGLVGPGRRRDDDDVTPVAELIAHLLMEEAEEAGLFNFMSG